MPYIEIKAYPKDEATKQAVAEEINRIFLEKWGCRAEAISIRFAEYPPDKWDQQVYQGEILPNADKMRILSGKPQKPSDEAV